ncbi:MAG TPA: type 1 glutamine amidotransferase [Solirubrobacterales bacterium]
MRVLAVTHQRDAAAGVFADACADFGAELDAWWIANGEAPPADPLGYDAVFAFGGSMNAHEEDQHPWLRDEKALLRALVEREVPLLGVCLGAQMLADALGGSAPKAAQPEFGWHRVEVLPAGEQDPLVGPLKPAFEALEWHRYEIALPPGAVELARSALCVQAFRVGSAPAWGIQFHAEVSEADALSWLADDRGEDYFIATGIDPARLEAEIRERIGAWNDLGREFCTRFLRVAAGARTPA